MTGRVIPFISAAHGEPSQLLRAMRERCGLSPREFAPILGVAIGRPDLTAGALKAWENGAVRVSPAILEAAALIARELALADVDVAAPLALLDETGDPAVNRRDVPSSTTGLPEPCSQDQLPAHADTAVTDDDAELAARSLMYHTDAACALRTAIDLGRTDMRRREAILKASYGIAALCLPSRDWLLAVLERATSPRPRIGMSEIDGMRKIFAAFQEMDVCGGGGERARTALVGYFNDRVVPLLDQHHKPDVRQALFQAASEQTYLAGWMAYEAANHGLAERYLIQSLRLAQESGDTLLGAHVLAGMSDQATLLVVLC